MYWGFKRGGCGERGDPIGRGAGSGGVKKKGRGRRGGERVHARDTRPSGTTARNEGARWGDWQRPLRNRAPSIQHKQQKTFFSSRGVRAGGFLRGGTGKKQRETKAEARGRKMASSLVGEHVLGGGERKRPAPPQGARGVGGRGGGGGV